METNAYQQKVLERRQKMDASLRRENGWLALAGLFWLHEGRNSFGSDPSNDIVLPARVPAQAGYFDYHSGQVSLHLSEENSVLVNGQPVSQAELQPDTTGSPDLVTIDGLTMVLIQRGERYGVRLWDNHRPERQSFPGRKWFPIQDAYRLGARFIPSQTAETMAVPDFTGEFQEMEVEGILEFSLHGQIHRLLCFSEEEGELFLIFKDQTSGRETYPAGRYLKTEKPQDGEVEIDFNLAYNPPCAFTPYATCPLPPPQNRLGIRVEAGERYESL